MNTQAGKWGSSVAVRIPAKIAEALGIEPGTQLDLAVEGDAVVIRRKRPKVDLKAMLDECERILQEDPDARYPEEFSEPMGKEIL